MEDRRRMMVMMNWDSLEVENEDDLFFESLDRISSAVSLQLASSSSDEDDKDYNDSRISFVSSISSASSEEFRGIAMAAAATPMSDDYNIWMAEPGSIKDRRKRLLQGMGLSSDKELLRLTSSEFKRDALRKSVSSSSSSSSSQSSPLILSLASTKESKEKLKLKPKAVLVRSRSDGGIESAFVNAKRRREEFMDGASSQVLNRSSSALSALLDRNSRILASSIRLSKKESGTGSTIGTAGRSMSNNPLGVFFVIKNLDTGKEFIVNQFDKDGRLNKLCDLQTGKQLSMEEFDKCVGYSPIVKELMHRENVSRVHTDNNGVVERKIGVNYFIKNFRFSKRRGVAWLKNIKDVANTMSGFISDKEREQHTSSTEQQSSKSALSEWTKVHQHGKSYKELTGLHICQEFQAHQGSIWTIKFNFDARYLASAGEDRVIHIWEVLDCDEMSLRLPDKQEEQLPLAETSSIMSQRKGRGKFSSSGRKGSSIPDYVVIPETVFSLSEKPVCSFPGHLNDVLDLSWSKSQQLLSSSMDKTVRLWDMETKSCLKLFAHNDYVTCIQFNPIDDRYFISGSLDAKVRIWSIPDRQVVDWTDLHEMVTAACYTPDGQGALVGSHKGSCRLYNTSESKLNQKGLIHLQSKKKSHAKKITGFQFAPGNPSEVLITSADSRIRIFDGSEVIHKFRGFRNTSSQISASFTADGKYVICASEDSQVYVWKRDEIHNAGGGKSKGLITTTSHEHFQCRDVSVAIAWPCSIKGEAPTIPLHSKRHQKRPSFQPPLSNEAPIIDDALISTSKRHLPPLPKKSSLQQEAASGCPEEDLANKASSSDSGNGGSIGSFTSDSSSFKYSDLPSTTSSRHSSSPSWSWFDGSSSNGNHCVQATAWGLVIVTAGLGGEIRIYQNFGIPLRLGRQTNLFKDLT